VVTTGALGSSSSAFQLDEQNPFIGQNYYVFTSSPVIDLGSDVAGRPGMKLMSQVPTLNLSLTGVPATMNVVTATSGTAFWFAKDQPLSPNAAGKLTGEVFPPVAASVLQNDELWLLFAHRDVTPTSVTRSIVGSFMGAGLDSPSDISSIQSSLGKTPAGPYSFVLDQAALKEFLTMTAPLPETPSVETRVVAHTGAAAKLGNREQAVVESADLYTFVSDPSASSTFAGTYANPFPSSWTPSVTVWAQAATQVPGPVADAELWSSLYTALPDVPNDGSTVHFALSLPVAPMIEGVLGPAQVAPSTATPTITWSAPIAGNAAAYLVRVGATSFITTETHVRLPPGAFDTTQPSNVSVTALAHDPTLQPFHAPWATSYATAAVGILLPPGLAHARAENGLWAARSRAHAQRRRGCCRRLVRVLSSLFRP
jgi:hypothetical protein